VDFAARSRVITPADPADIEAVTALLGRSPKTEFEVVVRLSDGTPVVTRNAPFEHDGTPMPTRYWLLPSSRAAGAIGRLESMGGVRRAEREVSADAIAFAHTLYANERNADIDPNWVGPRPVGGVGGTRQGLKCLHAHYAFWLSGADDAVGAWVSAQLEPNQQDERVIR
jgi:uncharacterized protein